MGCGHDRVAARGSDAALAAGRGSAAALARRGGSPTTGTATGGATRTFDAGYAPVAGRWIHLAFTWDGATGNMFFYANAVQQGASVATGITGTIFNGTADFRIGLDATTNYFNGNVAHVRIWNAARTQPQIEAAMYRSLPGDDANLAGYYRLDGDYTDGTINANDVAGQGVVAPSFTSDVPIGSAAQSLVTSGRTVELQGSPEASAGQVLTATGATSAEWKDLAVQAARGDYITVVLNTTKDAVLNGPVEFDAVAGQRGGLALDGVNHRVTGLKAGRTYLLMAQIRIQVETGTFCFWDVTNDVRLSDEIGCQPIHVTRSDNTSSTPVMSHVIEPTGDIDVEVRSLQGGTTDVHGGWTWFQVIEIGAVQAEVTGGLEFVDIIEVTSSVASVAFGAGGDGAFNRALDGDVDEEYVLSYYWPKPDTTLRQLEIHPNGVDVGAASNWDRHISSGTTGSGSGWAFAVLGSAGTGTTLQVNGFATIYAKTGKKRTIGAKNTGVSGNTTDVIGVEVYSSWDDTSTNITGLTIIDESLNLPVGSRFVLYRRTRANLRADSANSYERTVSAAVPEGTATTEYTTGLVVHGGSVVGVLALLQDAVTAGTVTVNVKVEGTTVISTVLDTTNTTKNSTRAPIGFYSAAAGDEVTVEVATSGYTNAGSVTSGIVVQVGLINSALILDGSQARRTLIDSSDALVYDMVSATTGSLPNSGSAAGGDLTGTGTPLIKTGLLSTCIDTGAISAKNLYSGAAGVAESSSISVSMWVKPKSVGSLTRWFTKEYRNDNTWSAPFWSITIESSSATNLLVGVTVGGTNYSRTISNFNHGLGSWHHVGLTYDPSTGDLYAYHDGQQWGPTNVPGGGVIDYGTSGTWVVGGVRTTGAPAEHAAAQFEDVRIANVVRPASWFEDVWRRGLRLT